TGTTRAVSRTSRRLNLRQCSRRLWASAVQAVHGSDRFRSVLADDVVASRLLDDVLDLVLLVPRLDEEQGVLGTNPLVFGRRNDDGRGAREVAAFADDVERAVAFV